MIWILMTLVRHLLAFSSTARSILKMCFYCIFSLENHWDSQLSPSHTDLNIHVFSVFVMPNLNCYTLNEKCPLFHSSKCIRVTFPLSCQINGPIINIQFYSFNENCVQIKIWINCSIMQKNFLIKGSREETCMMPDTKWPS